MSGRLDFEFGFSQPQASLQPVRSEAEPRRILVMSELGGRASGPLSARPLHEVDLDTFDDVIARIAPHIALASGELAIGSLDHFHPDSLLAELPAFRALLDLRKRLLDPATFAAAAAELGVGPAAEVTAGDSDEDPASTFERLLGKPPGGDATGPSTPAGGKIDLNALLKGLVAPHIVPAADLRTDACVATVDAAIGDLLRATLHDPAFQALEAAWRGVDWLRTELELGEDWQLFVCDLTREDLLADLRRHADRLDESELYRLVYEQEAGTPGGRSWSLLLGNFAFGPGDDDVFILAALGAIAARAGAPFLAGGKAEILGCRSLVETPDPATWSPIDPDDPKRWAALRSSPQAAWLGLALPRVLMRLPYGASGEELDTVAFEELTADPAHESFLWGNAAFAGALHLAQHVAGMKGSQTLDGLPAVSVVRDGSTSLQPCAEVLLSERVGRSLLDLGMIPMMSHRDRNAVTILQMRSLAEPPRPFEGW